MARMARIPLTSRPLDFLYFLYFCIHLPASILVDFQGVYPKSLPIPETVKFVAKDWVKKSGDPLLGPALGLLRDDGQIAWFKSFVYLEAIFQLPCWIIGAVALWRGSRSVYPLLLAYGASTATTTLGCLAQVLATPRTSTETIARGIVSITSQQQMVLLSSYVPFLIIPALIALDMAVRIHSLVNAATRAETKKKTK